MMNNSYWKVWAGFLERWGLKVLACEMMDHARPLFPLVAQALVLGLPLFKSAPFGGGYQALVYMLGDEEHVALFSQYLQKGGA
jgi:hypothetical protein